MRIAFDSNVLISMAGGNSPADEPKAIRARQLFTRLVADQQLVVPVQALGEAYRVLSGKFRFPAPLVTQVLTEWETSFEVAPTSSSVMREAVALAIEHRLQIWDAVILAAAVDADCPALLSEDMQDGFIWRGLTVINPFADRVHPVLASLLE